MMDIKPADMSIPEEACSSFVKPCLLCDGYHACEQAYKAWHLSIKQFNPSAAGNSPQECGQTPRTQKSTFCQKHGRARLVVVYSYGLHCPPDDR